jgi:hypothetical protein
MGKHTSRVNRAKYLAASDSLVGRIVARREVSPEGCWLWPSYVNPDGYGTVRITMPDGRKPELMIHRLIYMRLVGDIADDQQVDHMCHDPRICMAKGRDCPHRRCYNPGHLQAVGSTANLMRSGNFAAINADKDRCIRGHLFTPSNTHITPDGERRCRACARWHAANGRAARRTAPPSVRICRGCAVSISHLAGSIWYCEQCEPIGRFTRLQQRRAEKREAMRLCPDCGTSISDRHLNAIRCEPCSEAHARETSRQAGRRHKQRHGEAGRAA